MRRLKFKFVTITIALNLGLGVGLVSNARAADGVTVNVTRIGDASHFEFSGPSTWKYDLKKSPDGRTATLRLPALKSEALTRFKSLTDSNIKSVQVNPNGVDSTTELTFQLAPTADLFDYISEQPTHLIIDVFPKMSSVGTNESRDGGAESAKSRLSNTLKNGKAVSLSAQSGANLAEQNADGDDDETDEPSNVPKVLRAKEVASALPQKGAARKPAGGDFVLLAKKDAKSFNGENAKSSLGDELASAQPHVKIDRAIGDDRVVPHGIFDGGDPEFRRFKMKDFEIKPEAIAVSRANFYLPFPMLELGSTHLKSLLAAPPIYEIVPVETEENKEARLLLTLFSNKRPALFLQTADGFLHKHPNSAFEEIVRYMIADTHMNLYRSEGVASDYEAALGMYNNLTERYPKSPLTERTLLLTGYSYLEHGDSFGALKTFQRFERVRPESKYLDQVKISIAEAYLNLDRFDDATKIFDGVESKGKSARAREEAAYRKGDVLFRSKKYDQAIASYQDAMKKYPAAAERFPNAYYNTAESDFISHRYREGLENYRQFLEKFPDHTHGGYAMTRMGEILQILGADPKRIAGAYLESGFRYRSTPGAGIARIRLLTDRMPEMKGKELEDSMREIAVITEKYSDRPKKEIKPALGADGKPLPIDASAKSGEPGQITAEAPPAATNAETGKKPAGEGEKAAAAVPAADAKPARVVVKKDTEPKPDPLEKKPVLSGIDEFTTLLVADGYKARGEYDKSAKNLITYYQKYPQSPIREKVLERIVDNMTSAIHSDVDQGDFIQALKRYSGQNQKWLKNAKRVDLDYDVARAYDQAGVSKEALQDYQKVLADVDSIRSKKDSASDPASDSGDGSGREASQETERSVYEKPPLAEQVRLKMAAVSAREHDYAIADTQLRAIGAEAKLSQPEQIQRAELSAQVAEARGDTDRAEKFLTDLIKAWKGDPELTSPLRLRLARLLGQKKNFVEAEKHLGIIMQMHKDGEEIPEDVLASAMEMRANFALSRGKRKDAIAAYEQMITEFEGKRPTASTRYKVGELYYQDGDLKSAEKFWTPLKPGKDDIWQKLASEQMKSAKWQNDYKKYLSRIPAAADLKGGTKN